MGTEGERTDRNLRKKGITMTIREWARRSCVARGMFEDQAKAVIDMAVADKCNAAMVGRWDEPTDAYPEAILAILVMSINRNAITYIEANYPKAWFKPMFES